MCILYIYMGVGFMALKKIFLSILFCDLASEDGHSYTQGRRKHFLLELVVAMMMLNVRRRTMLPNNILMSVASKLSEASRILRGSKAVGH